MNDLIMKADPVDSHDSYTAIYCPCPLTAFVTLSSNKRKVCTGIYLLDCFVANLCQRLAKQKPSPIHADVRETLCVDQEQIKIFIMKNFKFSALLPTTFSLFSVSGCMGGYFPEWDALEIYYQVLVL